MKPHPFEGTNKWKRNKYDRTATMEFAMGCGWAEGGLWMGGGWEVSTCSGRTKVCCE